MSEILAVAFDLDGTMVNSEDVYDQVLTDLLESRGFRFDLELKRSMMGLKAEDAFAVLTSRFEFKESRAELKKEVERLFARYLPRMLRLMPGLTDLFELIDQQELPRCVTTSSPRALAHLTLGLVGTQQAGE